MQKYKTGQGRGGNVILDRVILENSKDLKQEVELGD